MVISKNVFNQTVEIDKRWKTGLSNMTKMYLRDIFGKMSTLPWLPIGEPPQTRSTAPCTFINSSDFNSALLEKIKGVNGGSLSKCKNSFDFTLSNRDSTQENRGQIGRHVKGVSVEGAKGQEGEESPGV